MSKIWYDKKARHRSFKPDDEVMALLPLPGKPIHTKLYGPYRVLEKLGPVNYRIETPDRRKTERICYVNLLKPYRRRDETQFPKSALPVEIVTSSPCEDFGETIPAIGEWKQSNEFVPDLSHLTTPTTAIKYHPSYVLGYL